jgi:hypothetical protein
MNETRITIELDREEALVLLDLLFRWIGQEHGKAILCHIRDDAEIWALNALFCLLETQVPEILSPDYDKDLQEACERLRERFGDSWPWRPPQRR